MIKLAISSPPQQNQRLDKFLKQKFPNLKYHNLQKMLRKGLILVNGQKISNSYILQNQDIITLPDSIQTQQPVKQKTRANPQDIQLITDSIIHKDQNIIVLNKPQGLAVQGGSGVVKNLDMMLEFLKFEQEQKPKLVHRLDKDTSGILLLARNSKAAQDLGDKFRGRGIKKTYLALVLGIPNKKSGIIDIPLAKINTGNNEKVCKSPSGKPAKTKYEILKTNQEKNLSLLKLHPITGRTHQLRVHCLEISHPIIGDGKYAGKRAFIEGLHNKLHLHAYQIEFNNQQFQAPLPPKFQKDLEILGMNIKDIL